MANEHARRVLLGIGALAVLGAGCTREPSRASSATATATATARSALLQAAGAVTFVAASGGDAQLAIARAQREAGAANVRRVLVYVGASWCEPCQRFHAAAKRGELDAALGPLTLIEFDADADTERLLTAGYEIELLPYFARASADGKPQGRKLQGSVKGPTSPTDLSTRLRALLQSEGP